MVSDRPEKWEKDALIEAALWALQYFEATDRANAVIHCAPVKYSPVTFRLAQTLKEVTPEDEDIAEEVAIVMRHRGLYEEDPGR
jgi:hypothetical protein